MLKKKKESELKGWFFVETEWTSGNSHHLQEHRGEIHSSADSTLAPTQLGKVQPWLPLLESTCLALPVWYSPLCFCGPGFKPLSALKTLPKFCLDDYCLSC